MIKWSVDDLMKFTTWFKKSKEHYVKLLVDCDKKDVKYTLEFLKTYSYNVAYHNECPSYISVWKPNTDPEVHPRILKPDTLGTIDGHIKTLLSEAAKYMSFDNQYLTLMRCVAMYLDTNMDSVIGYTDIIRAEEDFERFLISYSGDAISKAVIDISDWYEAYAKDCCVIKKLNTTVDKIICKHNIMSHNRCIDNAIKIINSWKVAPATNKEFNIYDRYIITTTMDMNIPGTCAALREALEDRVIRLIHRIPDYLVVSYNCYDYSYLVDLRIRDLGVSDYDILYKEFGNHYINIGGIVLQSTMRS